MKTTRETGFASLRQRVCFLAIIVFLIFSGYSIPLSAQQRPSRQSSLEAFSKGDFELAYREFSELLVAYPKDPLYKYYSGVCLVKLKRDPDRAVELLKEAKQNVTVVRNIPDDLLFWLGRAQHMSGMFEDAVDSYNAFTAQTGKKSAKETGVPVFIQECMERKGSIGQPEAEVLKPQAAKEPAKTIVKKDSVKVSAVVQAPVSKEIVRETISDDYDKLLSVALQYQDQADSIQRIIEDQKVGLEKLSYKDRTELKSKMYVSQHLADSLQNLADSTFNEAQVIMNKTPFVTASTGKDTSGKLQVSGRKDLAPASLVNKTDFKKDTISAAASKKAPAVMPQKEPAKDTVKAEAAKSPPLQKMKPENIFSYFEIIPKPVYKPDEKVQINPEIPPGLIYRIQTAVFKNPVAPSYFKGISPVYGLKSSTSGLTIYYTGMFRRLADAKKALTAVKQKGFKDAFVASFFEGKVVSPEKAEILEKEWGKKPFKSIVQGAPDKLSDTIPPTLSFRVEVMRSNKPLKDDVIEGMKRMAGTRGMETVKLDEETMVFLIGMFITYESAEEYADLLVKNGYRDAKVAAWLGKKEIPVETARKLFDGLK